MLGHEIDLSSRFGLSEVFEHLFRGRAFRILRSRRVDQLLKIIGFVIVLELLEIRSLSTRFVP